MFLLQVNDILGKYPEIMEGFNEFLLNCEDIGEHICLPRPYAHLLVLLVMHHI